MLSSFYTKKWNVEKDEDVRWVDMTLNITHLGQDGGFKGVSMRGDKSAYMAKGNLLNPTTIQWRETDPSVLFNATLDFDETLLKNISRVCKSKGEESVQNKGDDEEQIFKLEDLKIENTNKTFDVSKEQNSTFLQGVALSVASKCLNHNGSWLLKSGDIVNPNDDAEERRLQGDMERALAIPGDQDSVDMLSSFSEKKCK